MWLRGLAIKGCGSPPPSLWEPGLWGGQLPCREDTRQSRGEAHVVRGGVASCQRPRKQIPTPSGASR